MDLTPFSVLTNTFEQVEKLRSSPSLNAILEELRGSSVAEPFFDNYASSSYSVKEDRQEQLIRISKAFASIESRESSFDQLKKINHIITQDKEVMRNYDYEHVPFCSFESRDKGIERINSLESSDFVHLVAIAQFTLSMHLFENANHRTIRLWLDYHLINNGLPPTTFKNPSEWLIANITSFNQCSLEEAVQKTLYLLGHTVARTA